MRSTAPLLLLLTAATAGCGGGSSGGPDAAPDAGDELVADAGSSFYALVGEEVVLDGSATTGAVSYQWSFGNGDGWDAPRADPTATLAYDEPGRYTAVLTAFDADGRRDAASLVVSVTEPIAFAPRQSGTVAVIPGARRVAVVSPDSDELAVFTWNGDGNLTLEARHPTADEPRTVAVWGRWLAVACQEADAVDLVAHDGSGDRLQVALPRASRPYGVVAAGDDAALYVTLQATGALAVITLDAGETAATVDAVHPAIADARGVALLPDGRVAVTRWRSPRSGAEIAAVDAGPGPATGDVETWTLAFDPRPSSDTESGGVPSYLDQLLVSPDGHSAIVPSLQANVGEGAYNAGIALGHDTTVRAVLSRLDATTGAEDLERRKLFDDRGFAAAAAFTRRGDFAFVAARGSRAVDRVDMLASGVTSGTLVDVGFAPQGLALSPDDRFLFIDAYLSRELVVFDVSDFSIQEPIARATIPSSEPLAAEILRGKQLFNDSFDPRIAGDGYIACAHCHLDGMSDGRVWDFTDRGEGLRNTITLLGRRGAGHGPIHWSGNFDEVQDFEHDIRNAFGGTGLMSDDDFHTGTRDTTLGDPKAGVSADLDALAAYVTSLDAYPPSPFLDADGSLTAAAARGRTLFESAALGCTDCHGGPDLTDSQFESPGQPLLHDVGTLGPGSGQRLGGPLTGIDTPSLRGLWNGAPYLHDGSAATVREVVTTRNPDDAHGVTGDLTSDEIDDLVAYLLSL